MVINDAKPSARLVIVARVHKVKVLLLLPTILLKHPLICILSLSNSQNNAASIQENLDDKSHLVITLIVISIVVALIFQ